MSGRLTIFQSTATLAKRWALGANGSPIKSSAAQMTSGSYSVREFRDVRDLAGLLEGLTTQEAVSSSLPLDGSVSGAICTKSNWSPDCGAKVRGKSDFRLTPGAPAMLLVDHDAEPGAGGLSREELWSHLVMAVPALARSGVLWRPSGSSHIYRGEQDLTGLRGQHLLVLLADGSDGPRVIKTLAARLWLAGLGRIEISKSGALLERCPVDTSPSDAARLIFAAGAECVPPLEQRRGPAVVLSNGGFLDSRADVPDLTDAERGRYEALVEQARAAALPQAMQRRAEHRGEMVAQRLPALMKQGLSASDAEARIGAAVDAAYKGVLLGEFELTAVHDDGRQEVVTVAQVLSDRDRWNEVDTLDPINPKHRGGSPDARLYLLGTSPILYSLDDGGAVYQLRAAQQRLVVSKGNRGELVSQIAAGVADDPRVFVTDAGPVLVERGRVLPLTVERLMNLVGSAFALVTRGLKGDSPTDMQRETAVLVLAALNT